MNKKIVALILIVVSFGLLIPGVTAPIYEIKLNADIDAKLAQVSAKVLDEKRSIFSTVEHLYRQKKVLVAFLIFFFSVIIPVLKGFILLTCLLKKDLKSRLKLVRFTSIISKWSMADVFVIAIFLAFLATSETGTSSSSSLSFFGSTITIKINALMQSQLGTGFYYFLSYCLLSIASGQLCENIFNSNELEDS